MILPRFTLREAQSGYWARWFGVCIDAQKSWQDLTQNAVRLASAAGVPPHEILLGAAITFYFSPPFHNVLTSGDLLTSDEVRETCMGGYSTGAGRGGTLSSIYPHER